jgi:site-specific DNA-methyltransferase (adenine-specific)
LRSLYQAARERENGTGRTGGTILINMMNRDCMEYMATLPDKAFDLAIVDPPYGIGMDGGKRGKATYIKKEWDSMPPPQEYFDELFRVSKNQIIWGGNYFNLPPSQWIVWDKLNGESFFADGELAWTSFSRPMKIFKHAYIGRYNPEPIKIHPTQKPVALYKWLLSRYAKPGDRILDTHGGSGSICIACHDLGYDLTWMELDKDYYEAAVERYQNHAAQATLFEPAELTKETQGDLF